MFLPGKLQPVSVAQWFVNCKFPSGKVVVFIKPTCPYLQKDPRNPQSTAFQTWSSGVCEHHSH
uniref:Glutaredoxin like 1 n=1 Tax=Rattus norvegicus TaxID=10116 RepID=Q6AY00_RAT|nr:LOC290508 protein [Rattus norvegicus]